MLQDMINRAAYMAHGYCLLWKPWLVAMHASSDILIFGSYFAIPVAIWIFLSKRKDLTLKPLAVLFAAFIFLCGLTHVIQAVTLWWPVYETQGYVKAITAIVSVATAIAIFPLIPKAVAIPSPGQLQIVNDGLTLEVAAHRDTLAALKRSNDELEMRVAEALAAARRMEAVGQLAGSVAHDFNNLLTVIMGNLEFAKAHTVDERVRKHLLVALDAASVGASFSQRVLSLARKRTLEPVILDLNSRVKEAVKLIERVAGEHIVLNFRLGPELWLTRADRGEIDSALLNLSANARDAMPKGGTLTIETRNVAFHREEPRPDPQARDVDYVLLTVTDTGAGMSDEVLRRAGEPFFTTKKDGKGTGLGLSSVASFAGQSGGFIRIESDVGKGTSVGLYLPRANAQPASEDAPASEEPTPLGNGELILVVEDDANVREITLKRLEGLGYAVTDARSGPQAIELLRREGPVDLVFSDIVMPGGMTGYDIARWLSANQPAVKVVLATGYDSGHRVSEQQRDDLKLRVLNKPYSRSQLAQAIYETLNAA